MYLKPRPCTSTTRTPAIRAVPQGEPRAPHRDHHQQHLRLRRQAPVQSPRTARRRLCGQPPSPRGRTPQPRLCACRGYLPGRQQPGHARAPAASGLRFANPNTLSLLQALILFRQLPDGFRSADLRHHLAALSARSPQAIYQGAATYQLRRLHIHGLIERAARQLPLPRHPARRLDPTSPACRMKLDTFAPKSFDSSWTSLDPGPSRSISQESGALEGTPPRGSS
jgi:hypothetical protein